MYTTKRMSCIGKLFPILSVTAAVLCLAAGVAQADTYSQNFDGVADGTTGSALGDGSEIGSTANAAGVITAQVLGDRLIVFPDHVLNRVAYQVNNTQLSYGDFWCTA